jgi:hypothetical protein
VVVKSFMDYRFEDSGECREYTDRAVAGGERRVLAWFGYGNYSSFLEFGGEGGGEEGGVKKM